MDDLISRKEAIDWVQNILATHLYYHPRSKSRNVPIDEVIDRLERLPFVDAVKHGRWIKHNEIKNIYGGKYIECSECGEKYVVQYIEDEKFCRNCGARMDERKES